eukprot:31211-Pelagococcus_subviridis.AAC.2
MPSSPVANALAKMIPNSSNVYNPPSRRSMYNSSSSNSIASPRVESASSTEYTRREYFVHSSATLSHLAAQAVVPLRVRRQAQEEAAHDRDRALFLLRDRLRAAGSLPHLLVALPHEDGEYRLQAQRVDEPLARGDAPRERVVHALDRRGPRAPLALNHEEHQLETLALEKRVSVRTLHDARAERVEEVGDHFLLAFVRRIFALVRRDRLQKRLDAPELAQPRTVRVVRLKQHGEHLRGDELVVIDRAFRRDAAEEPLEQRRLVAKFARRLRANLHDVLHAPQDAVHRGGFLRRRLFPEPMQALDQELEPGLFDDGRRERGAALLVGLHGQGRSIQSDVGVELKGVRSGDRRSPRERDRMGTSVQNAPPRRRRRRAREGAPPRPRRCPGCRARGARGSTAPRSGARTPGTGPGTPRASAAS